MKKIIIICLFLVSLISLVSCDNNKEPEVSLDLAEGTGILENAEFEPPETVSPDDIVVVNDTVYSTSVELISQVIESFEEGIIDDTGFPYETLPPIGTVFPEDIQSEIDSNDSFFNFIINDDNSYIAQITLINNENETGEIYMYIEYNINDDNSWMVETIYFSEDVLL